MSNFTKWESFREYADGSKTDDEVIVTNLLTGVEAKVIKFNVISEKAK